MTVPRAVLVSPPLTSGARTLNSLRLVGDVLGLANAEVVNLLDGRPSTSTPCVVGAQGAPLVWLAARRGQLTPGSRPVRKPDGRVGALARPAQIE